MAIKCRHCHQTIVEHRPSYFLHIQTGRRECHFPAEPEEELKMTTWHDGLPTEYL